jgi:ketosteroid isomerase-like protein
MKLASAIAAAAAASALLAAAAFAQSTDAVQNEIRSSLENWRSAFNDRDEGHICDLFAPDLIANYQGEPEHDYTSLCQLLHKSLQDREATYHYSLKINEILVFGDTAVVRLVWTLETDKNGAAKETTEEPAIDIFRRQPGGSWKISRYLAYSTSP